MSDLAPRLLRAVLRRAAADLSSTCIDASTLAAWADRSLTRRERAAVESHAASCVRCQALVAAMARTAPAEAPRRRWRASNVGWLVPIAAASAALALWIAVPGPRAGRSASAPAAKTDTSTRQATAPAVPSQPSPLPESPSAAPLAAADRSRASSAATAAARPQAPAAVAAPAREVRPASTQALAAKDPAADLIAPQAAAPSPSPLEAAASSTALSRDAKAAETQTDQSAPAAASSFNSRPARSTMPRATAAASAEIVSPDANVRWRISGASILRTVDGGATWQPQSSGANTALTTGAAPSPTVCWIVGAGGTVVRSIDGRTWERIAFPVQVDLIAIRASDAAHSVVTSVDGSAFATDDGGRTWQASGR